MGSLAGHVLPGCFFLLHGFLWALLSIWMHLRTRPSSPTKKSKTKREGHSFIDYKRDHRLVRKSWLPLPCCPRIPLEPIMKIALTFLGICAEAFFEIHKVTAKDGSEHGQLVFEVYKVYLPNGKFNELAKLHHITMYGAFLASGVIDLVTLLVKVPRQTSQIFFSVAFWVEYVLFYSHSDSEDPLNLNIHFLLTVVILSCVIFSALRVFFSSNFLINLGLGFCIMLQGTWFVQVGVSLFPPGGTNVLIESSQLEGEAQHAVSMYIYALFTWHVLLLAVSFLMLWIALACIAKRFKRSVGKLQMNSPGLDENERLIADESGLKSEQSVDIEMQDLTETAT